MLRSTPVMTSASTSTVALPRWWPRCSRYAPFGDSCRAWARTSTPYFFANPVAAGVASPSGLNAADTGGPVTSSSKSVWRSDRRPTRAVSRRGVLKVSMGASGVSRSSFRRASRCVPTCAVSPGSHEAGISSQPISMSSSRSMRSGARGQRFVGRGGLHLRPDNLHGELADAQDVGGALGDADAAARIEDVEQVRALEAVLERRQDEAGIEQRARKGKRLVEEVPVQRGEVGPRHLYLAEGVLRLLDLLLQAHLAIPHAAAPFEVEDVVHALQEHGNPLEAVGDLARDRLEIEAAHLLKIGELRDLRAVEQHLPADAPGAQRRRLPVVL